MSLRQDRLTETERKRTTKASKEALEHTRIAEKKAKIARELSKEAAQDISLARTSKTKSAKVKNMNQAESKIGKAADNLYQAHEEARDAQRALIVSKTIVTDRISGVPQHKDFNGRTFDRVGGLYEKTSEARAMAKRMGMDITKLKFHTIPKGKLKGKVAIYSPRPDYLLD